MTSKVTVEQANAFLAEAFKGNGNRNNTKPNPLTLTKSNGNSNTPKQ